MSHSSVAVARYLLDRASKAGRPLSPMKLVKLVYIAHGWMLGLYGRPLIREDVEAWKYGPVIRELYHEVKSFRDHPVPPAALAPGEGEPDFDEHEKSVMDQTFDIYGIRTAIQLSQMTHSPGTPWDFIYNEIGNSFTIPNDLIEDHYARLYEKYGASKAA